MKTILIVLLCYVLSYILNRLFSYIAAILHYYWYNQVLCSWKIWFEPNMTIKDLLHDISLGSNFNTMYEIRWSPIINILGSLFWLCCELLVIIFVIFICILRCFVYIYDVLNISNNILKIKHSVYMNKISYVTIIIYNKTCNYLYKLKNKFLNIKIS